MFNFRGPFPAALTSKRCASETLRFLIATSATTIICPVDAFDVLGLSGSETEAEIAETWKRLARLSHPDMHPDATPEQRAVLTRRMAEVNAAYTELSDPARKAAILRSRSYGSPADEHSTVSANTRHPRPGQRTFGCEMCGATPATSLSFKQVTGQVFRDLIRTFDARLCRDCGLAIGREVQSRTILSGWWGVFASFRNIAAIASNSNNLYKASLIEPPKTSRDSMFRPLPVGKSVFARPRTLIGLAALALLIAVGIGQSNSTGSTSGGGSLSTPSASNYETFRIGACVSGITMVTPVPCSSPHSGKIVSRATTASGCPLYTESFLQEVGFVFCIDDDL